MDLYTKMGDELRALFKDLFRSLPHSVIERQMEHILKIAQRIGGSIAEEAKRLEEDIAQYLKHPKDPKVLSLLKKHASRLEQETKEI